MAAGHTTRYIFAARSCSFGCNLKKGSQRCPTGSPPTTYTMATTFLPDRSWSETRGACISGHCGRLGRINGRRIKRAIFHFRAILHDERTFPEPDAFIPERFLNADGSLRTALRDAELAAFGFGRRICPGRHLACASMFIAIASVLSAFTVSKAVDEEGNVIEPSGEYLSGLVT